MSFTKVSLSTCPSLPSSQERGGELTGAVGTNLLNNQTVAIKFEPRKSDAPQLRDEYRTYKILAGLRKSGMSKAREKFGVD